MDTGGVLVKTESCSSSIARRMRDPPVLAASVDGELQNHTTVAADQQLRGTSTPIKRRRREPRQLPALQAVEGDVTVGTLLPTASGGVKRSSRFRGVSRHRWTGRYEAHLWDKGSWNATQRKKGKQVYLGAYTEEESAARAYDLAALKYWGATTFTNFPVSDYQKEIQIMQNMTKEEYLASIRRKSSGFSRGVSKYRGVARHHHNGRWEARIGRVFGNKYLYLGTYSTQEEAAHAYDIAAIEYRGINAITNFDLSTYIRWLRPGAHSNNQAMMQKLVGSVQQAPRTIINNTHIASIANNEPHQTSALLQRRKAFHQSNNNMAINPLCVGKQQVMLSPTFQYNNNMDFPSSIKASPSALSLLLRSSMFKHLVEKVSSPTTSSGSNCAFKDEDIYDANDIKYQPLQDDEDMGSFFYDGSNMVDVRGNDTGCPHSPSNSNPVLEEGIRFPYSMWT